jgi:hypothetical protein
MFRLHLCRRHGLRITFVNCSTLVSLTFYTLKNILVLFSSRYESLHESMVQSSLVQTCVLSVLFRCMLRVHLEILCKNFHQARKLNSTKRTRSMPCKEHDNVRHIEYIHVVEIFFYPTMIDHQSRTQV